MILDFKNLKASVIDECKLWQEEFIQLSKNVAQSNITTVYEFLKISSVVKSQSNSLAEFQVHLDDYNKLCAEVEENRKKAEPDKQNSVVYDDYFL